MQEVTVLEMLRAEFLSSIHVLALVSVSNEPRDELLEWLELIKEDLATIYKKKER